MRQRKNIVTAFRCHFFLIAILLSVAWLGPTLLNAISRDISEQTRTLLTRNKQSSDDKVRDRNVDVPIDSQRLRGTNDDLSSRSGTRFAVWARIAQSNQVGTVHRKSSITSDMGGSGSDTRGWRTFFQQEVFQTKPASSLLKESTIPTTDSKRLRSDMKGRGHNSINGAEEKSIHGNSIPLSLSAHSEEATLFSQENVDFQQRAPCGAHKCFFRLKIDNSTGYLVMKSPGEDLEKGWKMANYLQKEYGVKHLLLAPPQELNVTEDFASRLNAHGYKVNSPARKRISDRFSSDSTIIIQKSIVAPSSTLLFGCHPDRTRVAWNNFDSFIALIDKAVFVPKLEKEIISSMTMLASIPSQAGDYQVLIDKDGNFYQIDIHDNHHLDHDTDNKGRTSSTWKAMCDEAFKNLTSRVDTFFFDNVTSPQF